MAKKKLTSIAEAERELDLVFSQIVRLRVIDGDTAKFHAASLGRVLDRIGNVANQLYRLRTAA